MPDPMRQIAVRYPAGMLAEVDRWAAVEQRERSQMLRVLIREALAGRGRDEPDEPED